MSKRLKVLLLCFIATVFLSFTFKVSTILGNSMTPTYEPGEHVLFLKQIWISPPKKGDIIIFEKDGFVLIKRITDVYENGYYVLGDDQSDSIDSRDFGLVTKDEILGKVLFPRKNKLDEIEQIFQQYMRTVHLDY